MRPSVNSLHTLTLAAVDIGLGSVLYHHLTAPAGALLIAVGLLVLSAAVFDLGSEYGTAVTGTIDRLTQGSR